MLKRQRHYIPDPLGQGTWTDAPVRDPFGRLPESVKPETFDLSNLFDLTKPVGDGGRNQCPDVAKIETLLGKAGTLDLSKTGGPTGFAGQRLLDATKQFQKNHGLRPDDEDLEGTPRADDHALQSRTAILGKAEDKVPACIRCRKPETTVRNGQSG